MRPSLTDSPYNVATTSNGEIGHDEDLSKSSSRVMIHHDDLISVTPSVDISSPIKTIIRECEYLVKVSDASLEFRRPDIALQQYLQASIIAIEIIPRHKEYHDLQFDRPELFKLYSGLKERIKSRNEKFMEAKNIIKKNNLLHGTQPVLGKISPQNSTSNQCFVGAAEDCENEIKIVPQTIPACNGKPKKKPPAKMHKPEALLGQPIQTSSNQSAQAQNMDLATRFARLRNSEQNIPKQDPRIRTKPIPIPHGSVSNNNFTSNPQQTTKPTSRPAGPREMPSVPKIRPRIDTASVDVGIPDLPRAPDAIYSPARGTEVSTANNLLFSMRTNSFKNSNHQSTPPVSRALPSSVNLDGRRNSLALVRRLSQPIDYSRDQKPNLPQSNYVTSEELEKLLAHGTQENSILLVDLRSREAFDICHIETPYIICVEPITLRRDISGDQLADSMVIAPDSEQILFEKRNEFDLVVVYDQSSTKISDNSKILDFTTAVYDYGYEKRLKRHPLFLIAGLDGWRDLLGLKSLADTNASNSRRATTQTMKIARPLVQAVSRETQNSISQRQKRHYSRPLTMEQESIWASTIKEDMALNSSDNTNMVAELIYARTTEDFIRRYPELPVVQESMTSPTAPNIYQDQLVNIVPRPPARPAPAIPRQRSSGISEKRNSISYAHNLSNGESAMLENQRPVGLTGLSNPRVLCYMNTVIQGLSATSWFRELIKNYVYPANPPIPRREGESTDPPQLMVRCLSTVFAHLWLGQYEFINPATFQGYVNAVHNQGPGGFGGPRVQHDCNEFLVMLIDILDDELNPLRNLPGRRPIEEIEGSLENSPTVLDAAAIYWADWTSNLGSPITRRMKGVTARIIDCDICGKSRPVFDQFQQLLLAVPLDGSCTLNDILNANFGPKSDLIEYQSLHCSKCDRNTTQKGRVYLVYMPDTLIISFMRMTNNLSKIKTRITVPLTVNFENNMVTHQNGSKNQDFRCKGPFIYDLYGLGLHSGNTLASGHYRMLARSLDQLVSGNPAGSWHMFDDKNVTPFNVTAIDPSEISLLFLQRQGHL
ncbi:Ubiquitin carboxyl-terminal hydrolase 4 [Golovinomyces cichoracearum]|uniref:Ubiquitin carboxyl-terminal hydrolase 4 n=1 Tax=Golovinomyces cichoracearum TaxID=62708 RepID=A0A420HNI3_9PEZI|nr:Ubiquitin carboxyl-terminal hydrolase 4 [Golovinomyces cichoracearum]